MVLRSIIGPACSTHRHLMKNASFILVLLIYQLVFILRSCVTFYSDKLEDMRHINFKMVLNLSDELKVQLLLAVLICWLTLDRKLISPMVLRYLNVCIYLFV